MRFMIIRKADADTEAGMQPSRELAETMMAYHEEMGRHLKILDGNGLHPSATGVRLQWKGGKPITLDGPFAETKELLAGYTLVEADSLEQVMEWARRWPAECDGGDGLVLEIRRVYEMSDFEVFDDELQAKAAAVGVGGASA
ncbi:YciI family protein [Phenylobacterium sp. J367]|uniref:YciI family protein n=1 Tax=Phenylobacterium sp. J367 TaxID=2898435 RepID=UPI002150F307|nr:YciI family protein [Phenylobacterium sp. J367]MCR5880622.1 YciI family protein [Phenylobacterium sp. J367]